MRCRYKKKQKHWEIITTLFITIISKSRHLIEGGGGGLIMKESGREREREDRERERERRERERESETERERRRDR